MAALEGGDLEFVGEMLELLHRRGAAAGAPGSAKVVELSEYRAARKGEPK